MNGASLVAFVSLSSVVAAVEADNLVSFGMTLEQYNDVRLSEAKADFGGAPTTDELWSEALLFEYDLATSYARDKALTSLGYHPYVICNYTPDKTGVERAAMVNEAFQNTPGVDTSHFFFEGINELNQEDRSCGVVRAYNDTISKVYAANPDAGSWMKTNPLHAAMKMVDYAVEVIQKRMDGDTNVGMISIGTSNEDGYVTTSVLELSNVLCTGVRDFNGTTVAADEISQAAKDFVMDLPSVQDASFYYHKVNDEGGTLGVHYTERMDMFSEAISFVEGLTDATSGRNACLDKVINETMTFKVMPYIGEGGTGVLDVYSKFSEAEGYAIAEANNMTKGDVDMCIWYTLYAVALNPMICSVEPKSRPQTLCPDGITSDLSKCPSPAPAPTDQPSSGSNIWMHGVLLSLSVAVFSYCIVV
jgi:hypothetical protein